MKEKCPFCDTPWVEGKLMCNGSNCFAYKVTKDNYDIPRAKRYDLKEEIKNIIKVKEDV